MARSTSGRVLRNKSAGRYRAEELNLRNGIQPSPVAGSLAELPQFEVASNLEGSFSRSRSQRRR